MKVWLSSQVDLLRGYFSQLIQHFTFFHVVENDIKPKPNTLNEPAGHKKTSQSLCCDRIRLKTGCLDT